MTALGPHSEDFIRESGGVRVFSLVLTRYMLADGMIRVLFVKLMKFLRKNFPNMEKHTGIRLFA